MGWYLLGYGFAFGDVQPGNGFIGRRYFGMRRLPYAEGSLVGTTNGFTSWFFQFTFAATASTIVSGSVVERASITAYITYSFFLTAFVYPVRSPLRGRELVLCLRLTPGRRIVPQVVAHWEWSTTGWLSPTRAGASVLFSSGALPPRRPEVCAQRTHSAPLSRDD